MNYTKTFAMIKPGAVQRGLMGNIISRFENKGLKIISLKMIWVSQEQAKEHYAPHKDKPFYNDLVSYITASPVVVIALHGENAVELVRKMAGDTNPLNSQPGTIRGDFSADIENNIIHTSDSEESASRELDIYFTQEEYLEYTKVIDKWCFEFKQDK